MNKILNRLRTYNNLSKILLKIAFVTISSIILYECKRLLFIKQNGDKLMNQTFQELKAEDY
jgi:hypothetical protein